MKVSIREYLFIIVLSIILINIFVFRWDFIILSIITFLICYLTLSKIKLFLKEIKSPLIFSAILFICTCISFKYHYVGKYVFRFFFFYITEESIHGGILNGLTMLSTCIWFLFLDRFSKVPEDFKSMAPKFIIIMDCSIRFMNIYISEFKKYMNFQKCIGCDIYNAKKKLNLVFDILFKVINNSSQRNVFEDNFDIYICKRKIDLHKIIILGLYILFIALKIDVAFYVICLICIVLSLICYKRKGSGRKKYEYE